ncbi:probable enoyl-CoA hydratase isoform X3 [Gigantopelta aegis]|uniref:probable enoyl-CoA hydratase isoform X3 n=1 Tax=Gigantopelta aegis TaxID=1735272 RepID=UPI001B88D529|nr:probable enoyl-CoA hydratase isoform X3 [Gigantopelta aegis]
MAAALVRSVFGRVGTSRAVLCRRVSTNDQKLVETEKHGQVFLIGINRPEVRNCVDPETSRQLIAAFRQFDREEDLLVAVLHGHGGVFCAGYDLKFLSEVDASVGPTFKEPVESDEAPMGPSRMLCTKPVIAAVAGYAVAGGLELACMCDLRVVEESAVMGVFCRRFGVPLLDGGTVRLPRLIGLSRALDLILTGRQVSAKEAFQFGLANRLVATGTALGQSVQLAKEIAKHPQMCMKADRRSAYYSAYDAKSTVDAFQFEFENGIKVIEEESVKDDIFTQIHPPNMQGNTAAGSRVPTTTPTSPSNMQDDKCRESQSMERENEKPKSRKIPRLLG